MEREIQWEIMSLTLIEVKAQVLEKWANRDNDVRSQLSAQKRGTLGEEALMTSASMALKARWAGLSAWHRVVNAGGAVRL